MSTNAQLQGRLRYGTASGIGVALVILAFGILVGLRPDSIGADTANYRFQLQKIMAGDPSRFEPAFQWFMLITGSLGGDFLFFFSIYVCISLCYLNAARAVHVASRISVSKTLWPVVILSLLFSSSWFINSTTNGLRQGLAISTVYIAAFILLDSKNILQACALCALACLFHYSAILIVPMIFLARILPLGATLAIFFFASALYALNIFELLFEYLQEIRIVNVYSYITSYDDHIKIWFGWQWDFWLYTIGWGIIYVFGRSFIWKCNLDIYDLVLKLYMCFSIPYFILGFGNFSNRYAVLSWAFLPVIHFTWIICSRVSMVVKYILTGTLLIFGIFKFSTFLHPI